LGLYTTIDLKAGESLSRPLYMYGHLTLEEDCIQGGSVRHPVKLKSSNFDNMLLVPADDCVARMANDARGTGLKNNIVMLEEDVANLKAGEGYKLVELRPCCDIPAGAQLLVNYGTTFFTPGHPDDESTPLDDDDEATTLRKKVMRRKRDKQTGTVTLFESDDETAEEDDEGDEGDEGDSGEEDDEEPLAVVASKVRGVGVRKKKQPAVVIEVEVPSDDGGTHKHSANTETSVVEVIAYMEQG
jgi:hypothetical protein